MRIAIVQALSAMLPVMLGLSYGCSAELAADLDERQADEIVLALDGAGIGAEKTATTGERGRFRVVVPRADVAPALAVLRDERLPRETAPGFAELFADRGLVPSAADERARQSAAIAGELSRSLEAMRGVSRARVHLALPDHGSRPLDAAGARPRASVLLEHRRDARVDETAVRSLVQGAVPELDAADVSVVRTEARAAGPREPHLVTLGPITVTRGTASALKAVLAASLALNLVLASLLVLTRVRWRSARSVADAREPRTP